MQRDIGILQTTFISCLIGLLSIACTKKSVAPASVPVIIQPPVVVGSILNTSHLEKLAVQVVFPNGEKGEGIYIYADAPNYNPTPAGGEGFTCVDDVSREALFYLRSTTFQSDTLVQRKLFGLLQFLINMQSDNGYFYNFLQAGGGINRNGITSINQPKWWSWRALQTLAEAVPVIQIKNVTLTNQVNGVVSKLITALKNDLVNLPLDTIQINGIKVPQWLPEGADQAATLILGLIPYCQITGDIVMTNYIRKLADGIILMQLGDASHFPYSCFLSSGNTWHSYGNDQATALFEAGIFLNEPKYTESAMAEVSNFYPWILNSGYKNSFDVTFKNNGYSSENTKSYEQIAYGIRPMVFASIKAYQLTNDEKYADLAGHLASWFLGNNSATSAMFSIYTGRCYDAINEGNTINNNSGAESTIEALLTMQRVSSYPSVKTALDKYKLKSLR